MTKEHRTSPTAFWQAVELVVRHYYDEERDDFRYHHPSCSHIFHSLLTLRRELRRPPRPLDISAVLESRRQVAIIWSTEDVQSIRPDLTEDQAWDVLGRCRRFHDCNVGITWDILEWHAEDLYPAPVSNVEEEAK